LSAAAADEAAADGAVTVTLSVGGVPNVCGG
jgi:hypothetical protein